MPNIKSAKKRMRSSEKQRVGNLAMKTKVRTARRKTREALAAGTSARTLPLYNQVWSSLSRGDPLEADGYHRLVLDLAANKGIATPTNERVLDALVRAWRERRGPESISARELLGEALP